MSRSPCSIIKHVARKVWVRSAVRMSWRQYGHERKQGQQSGGKTITRVTLFQAQEEEEEEDDDEEKEQRAEEEEAGNDEGQ